MSTVQRKNGKHPNHSQESNYSFNLITAARNSMIEHGFQPDYPAGAEKELLALDVGGGLPSEAEIHDLRKLLWSSIDNDTSRDLDQIEWAERLQDGRIRILVGVADVDARMHRATIIDSHARSQTTSVYTGVKVFPMLPLALSEGATSLNENEDRAAMVVEFTVDEAGSVADGKVYRALVRNHAQLAYNAVGAWLTGKDEAPEKIAANKQLAAQVKLQDAAARRMANGRYQHGALDLETIETRPLMQAGLAAEIKRLEKNRATSLIEEFMVAANGVIARSLDEAGLASIRRVVRTPKRWERIVDVANAMGTTLPATPDSKALNDFLLSEKARDPERFPDLSLAIVKLMGPGEYMLVRPNDAAPGHFGLAVQDYTHSTAPNRRFADLVTQRLLKAWLAGDPQPYSSEELSSIASRCTIMEDGARKVEREMQKRIAAVVLFNRVGQTFRAVITGVNHYGTFVRTLDPHVEGMLVQGAHGYDVGDKLAVRLLSTDPRNGYIDFAAL